MKSRARAHAALERLRRRIDRLDASLLRLLAQRVGAARQAAGAKRALGRPVYDPARERGVRARLARLAPPGLPLDAVEEVYREVISLTRAQEAETTVACLGPEGSLGHWAAVQRFGRASQVRACPTIEELLRAVESGEAGYGVFSLEGQADLPGLDTFDVLLDAQAQLCGEFAVRGGLVVLARGRGGPRRIFAPVGLLVDHERWLHARFPGVGLSPAPSLAEGARWARARRGAACLGTPLQAAAPLGVVAAVGGRGARLARRFLVLARTRGRRSGDDKTLLLAALPHRPGALMRALEPLARRRINLLGIMSRVSRGRPWEHVFLLEVAGHVLDPRVERALREVHGRTDYFKILGSFPAEV